MSVATKTGDKGETSLLSGERVPKDDLRVESYGSVDELNSFLGDAKHYVGIKEITEIIEDIQTDLFRVCAELADNSGKFEDVIKKSEVDKIGMILNKIESGVKLTGFVIPGNSPGSAKLDVCRSVCRRAERRIITLNREFQINPHLIQYINRLSDLLFIMARSIEKPKRVKKI